MPTGERFLDLLWKSEAASDLGPHHSEIREAMGVEGHAPEMEEKEAKDRFWECLFLRERQKFRNQQSLRMQSQKTREIGSTPFHANQKKSSEAGGLSVLALRRGQV